MKKYKVHKKTSIALILIMLLQIVSPGISYALTSGPSQPEVQSFEPVGTSQMVDLFSGDFNYNIPLLEVGGYPINIAYHAGIGMEQEASWVGLGWSLNPGAINRTMRGIPDDFSGELINKEVHKKPNISVSFLAKPKAEALGLSSNFNISVGVRYNNYKGLSVIGSGSLGLQDIVKMGSFSLNARLGVDLESGISLAPSIYSQQGITDLKKIAGELNIGAQYNSRQGLSELTFSKTFNYSIDKNKRSFGNMLAARGINASMVSFNTPSYITSNEFDSRAFSFSLDLNLGGEIPFTNIGGSVVGSYSRHTIDGVKSFSGFGYMNHHLADEKRDLLDFNREQDGPFFAGTNVLPLTNLTNDVYGITGQGMGGVFRGFRNHVSYVSDPTTLTRNDDGSFGGDIGIPTSFLPFKGGGNMAFHFVRSYSGLWARDNQAIGKYNSKNKPTDSIKERLFEPAYFKQLGELSADQGRFENLGGKDPLAFVINPLSHELQMNLNKEDGSPVEELIEDRAIRNQITIAKSFKDALTENRTDTIRNYSPGLDANGALNYTETELKDYQALLSVNDRQIFEYSVLRPDGMRYIYGQPAYNLHKEDVIFSTNAQMPTIGDESGSASMINYTESEVGSGNTNGIDNFSSKESLPAYSYAHLITEVLSSDYSDITGDGPTDDDYGSWAKFNYSCSAGPLATNQENYNWRFPYANTNNSGQTGVANFNEGLKSNNKDNKANYTYGEKELWFLHSIESRTHIAVFHTSPRKDAREVTNALGHIPNDPMNGKNRKLDKIEYYAKHDLAEFGADAIPIKTVHLNYKDAADNEYTLCKGVPNNFNTVANSGKLTLRSLYFTYGNSKKGEYSKYQFDYNEAYTHEGETYTFDYSKKSQDRWGSYKKEPTGIDYNPIAIADDSPLSNTDFPYAEQEEALADHYAKAWNLSKIHLPSGGSISIEYESDDYAYLQDKRAGQMFTLFGLAEMPPQSLSNVNTAGNLEISGSEFNNYLVLKLDNPNNQAIDRNRFFHDYLEGIERIYFRSLVNIKDGKHEFVPGYMKYTDYGVFEDVNGSQTDYYAWIELAGVGSDENDSRGKINPIAKAGWQFARLHMPELVYPETSTDGNVFSRLIQSLVGIFTREIPRMLRGMNTSLQEEGFASRLKPSKSWIRLNNPNYYKKGGGCRVKEISMSDKWTKIKGDAMSSIDDASYGQQYFYEQEIKTTDGETRVISSGVANYEPILGNDENSLKQPIVTNESRMLAPDNEHYIETPIGESFYPSASIGYAQVIVADTRPKETSTRTTTGYSVNEFYTVKDFPFQTRINNGSTVIDQPDVINLSLQYGSESLLSASRGYSIILNDMHGKPKANWICGGFLELNEDDKLKLTTNVLNSENKISGQEYLYHLDENKNLDNVVQAINPDGSVSPTTIGIESEMALDFREHLTSVTKAEYQGNVDTWVLPLPIPPPIVVPTLWQASKTTTTRFRSAVATKLINQHGLLDKVRVFDQGAILETQNLVYDAQTGEVLLTSVNNEFRDKIEAVDPVLSEENLLYNMKYPAHWAYTGMQQAYQNIGLEMNLTVGQSGNINVTNAPALFHPGDELAARGEVVLQGAVGTQIITEKFWVLEVNQNDIVLADRHGRVLDPDYKYLGVVDILPEWSVKIVRSGYRNQQSMPIASMASLKNPVEQIFVGGLSGDDLEDQATNLEILDVSAQEFSNNWESFCGEGFFSDRGPLVGLIQESCSDVLFLIDKSDDVGLVNNLAMQLTVNLNTMILDGQVDGDYRYAVGLFDNDLELTVPFTDDAQEVLNISIPSFDQGTNIESSLGSLITWLDNETIVPRSECGLHVVLLTNVEADEINGYINSNTLKEDYDANLGVVRFRTIDDNELADERAAAVASPGWEYVGEVADNGGDFETKPRRFIPFEGGTFINFTDRLNYINIPETSRVPVPIFCSVDEEAPINPFLYGVLGNWRPSKSYVHKHVPREQPPVNSSTVDLANQGHFTAFDQFWNKPGPTESLWSSDPENYINTTEVTRYNPYGEALENKDALDIYSAALLGYDKKLAIAVGSNTKYNEMAYDGFEEYIFYSDHICGLDLHLDLNVADQVTMEEAHTGLYSLKIVSDGIASTSIDLNCSFEPADPVVGSPQSYRIDKCEECLPVFSPTFDPTPGANNKYVFDVWVKSGEPDDYIAVLFYDNENMPIGDFEVNFLPAGPVIDGWQRVYAFFEIPPNAAQLGLSFRHAGGGDDVMYLDDLRIYPFDANMRSFVYHPSSLKLMAELDENNHATFYEYDEEWNLVRVKKETERGIMTLQENRSHVRLDRSTE